mmetsp:Transcript_53688/g.89295  ORF Transcript_53688/g.89295 Transcript_53688/m.89295 type:complete len:229 (-) Transcript_53688:19-705(-)
MAGTAPSAATMSTLATTTPHPIPGTSTAPPRPRPQSLLPTTTSATSVLRLAPRSLASVCSLPTPPTFKKLRHSATPSTRSISTATVGVPTTTERPLKVPVSSPSPPSKTVSKLDVMVREPCTCGLEETEMSSRTRATTMGMPTRASPSPSGPSARTACRPTTVNAVPPSSPLRPPVTSRATKSQRPWPTASATLVSVVPRPRVPWLLGSSRSSSRPTLFSRGVMSRAF